MNSPKTCFLIPSVASGGIEMYLLRFLNYLEDTSRVTVLVRSNSKGELYEEYNATGVTLKFLPLGYLSPSKTLHHFQYYKEQKFDVICDFNANFAGVPMLLAKRLDVPKRIAFYRQGSNHFEPSFIKNRVNTYMNRLVYKNATHILSNSQAALDFFFPYRTADDTRFDVIYNGVNIEDYNISESKESIRKDLGIPQQAFVIGHVGRLDKAKNHETILKVFQQIQDEEFLSHLVLCGRDTEKLLPRIQELGIADKTTILGYRKDIPRVLKSLDCFFFPSITEGQPNALIEAMVSGVPIVASNIPAIQECIPKRHTARLRDPLDSAGLKTEIMHVVHQKTESISRKEAKRFDDKANFETFKKVLHE